MWLPRTYYLNLRSQTEIRQQGKRSHDGKLSRSFVYALQFSLLAKFNLIYKGKHEKISHMIRDRVHKHFMSIISMVETLHPPLPEP